MIKDATLERIWEARRRIYEKCGNDPVKLIEYYLKRQQNQSPDSSRIQKDAPEAVVCEDHPEKEIYCPAL